MTPLPTKVDTVQPLNGVDGVGVDVSVGEGLKDDVALIDRDAPIDGEGVADDA